MTSERQQFDGYYLAPDKQTGGRVMVLQGPWRNQYRSVIRGDVLSLRLSHSAGWQAEPLGFLEELPNLRSIEIYNFDVKDVSPIWVLKNLECIGLECFFNKCGDFSEFSRLTYFFGRWRPSAKTIFSVRTLLHLNVTGYPYEDLQALQNLQELKVLMLTSRKLTALNGIEKFSALEKLDLHGCTQLKSLDGIENASNALSFLWIDTCKRITDVNAIGLHGLVRVLRVTNCRSISSLCPLSNCTHLEELTFVETKIEDGDMSILLEIPRLRVTHFGNRRHYSHTHSEIQQALNKRG